jgi:hypothetical protein
MYSVAVPTALEPAGVTTAEDPSERAEPGGADTVLDPGVAAGADAGVEPPGTSVLVTSFLLG